MAAPRTSAELADKDTAAAIEYANGIIGPDDVEGNKFQKAIAAWRSERHHRPAYETPEC